MRIEDYIKQQAQVPQGAQSASQTQEPLEVLAARLDAHMLYSLQATAQAAIDDGMAPAAMLERITGALFGPDSPQAAAVAQAIEQDKSPAGREMAIATIRQQRQALRRQAKQLEARAKEITGELEKLDAAERDVMRADGQAAALDRALLDVLTFRKQLDPDNPPDDLLPKLTAIYDKHNGNPAAMGLLYGTLADLTRRQYSAKVFDLVQQQAFRELARRIAETISGAGGDL